MRLNQLTADDSDAQIELHHAVGEGGRDHPDGAEDAPQHDDGPAAVRVDQDAADGACSGEETGSHRSTGQRVKTNTNYHFAVFSR